MFCMNDQMLHQLDIIREFVNRVKVLHSIRLSGHLSEEEKKIAIDEVLKELPELQAELAGCKPVEKRIDDWRQIVDKFYSMREKGARRRQPKRRIHFSFEAKASAFCLVCYLSGCRLLVFRRIPCFFLCVATSHPEWASWATSRSPARCAGPSAGVADQLDARPSPTRCSTRCAVWW